MYLSTEENMIIIAMIAIGCIILYLYIVWRFIASAVQRGVEDALRYAPLQKTNKTTFASQTIKNGILEAMEELKIVEFKYYDENGKEVYIKREHDMNKQD